MPPSSSDQLVGLIANLQERTKALDAKIDEDERDQSALMDELKSLGGKLEEVTKRSEAMKMARNEYRKTVQEAKFAQQKIEESQQAMADKFTSLAKATPNVG